MASFSNKDLERYMKMCIRLARETSKEIRKPLVGSLVLSKEGKIVGVGSKSMLGNTSFLIHAERNAIMYAGELARGGTLFTTLEPCVKVKEYQVFKPCAELIVDSGIETVVMAIEDNSPSIFSGAGLIYLRKRRLEVILYDKLNHAQENLIPYRHFMIYKKCMDLEDRRK